MNYWFGYVAIGIVVLAAMLLKSNLAEKKNLSLRLGTLKYLGNPNPSFLTKFLDAILVPSLSGLLVISFWPGVLFFLAKSSIDDSRKKTLASSQEFRVTEQDLAEKLTISQIEQREIISDPHHAVPELPFGYLHDTWKQYREKLRSDDEIWSFRMKWENQWDGTQKVEGYVAVRDGCLGPHFITLRKSLDEGD